MSDSFRLIRPLFVVWNRLKPFEQFAVCTETAFWTVLNRLDPIEVHYMECFHQKPFLFDWRKKDMDILDELLIESESQTL